MKESRMQQVLHRLSEWYWRRQFDHTYSREAGLHGSTERLRLVLGVEGSGLGWVAAQLAEIAPEIPFYNEPLFQIQPRLRISAGADHTAIGFCDELPPEHSILRVYRLLLGSERPSGGADLDNRDRDAITDRTQCLVKETHALLASEALLKALGCPVVFIHRDPIRVVDLRLEHGGLSEGYLAVEQSAARRPAFLRRFLPSGYRDVYRVIKRIRRVTTGREQDLLQAVLTIALIDRMFHVLATRFPSQAMVARYESLTREPSGLVPVVVHLLGEGWRSRAEQFLRHESSTHERAEGASTGREDVISGTGYVRSFEHLSPIEVRCCQRMLADCGLDEGPMTELEDSRGPQCRYIAQQNGLERPSR